MMDLSLVFLLFLHSVLILPFLFQETEADQDPFSAFSEYLNVKDVKEDLKRRRKHARVQSISLKPPPKDWPEPEMAPGDFIVIQESEVTSLSPLLAYQAKLEQEYAMERKVNLQEELDKLKSEQTQIEAEFTSSEEDLQKLLDPDELLKHNKQLRPFINQGPSGGSQGPNEIQGKAAKLAGISSLTALKAKTDNKKSRKAKTVSSKVTTTLKPRRRRRKKTEKKVLENKASPKESKKKRRKSKLLDASQPSSKKRRKRVRTFAFAEKKFDKYESTSIKDKKSNSKSTKFDNVDDSKTDVPFWTTEISTEKIISNATKTTPEVKTQLQGIEETTEIPSNEITTSKDNTENMLFQTTTLTPIEHKLDSNSIEVASSLAETKNIESTTSELFPPLERTTGIATSNYTRNQIREKRKEIKQEMEKVLVVEELEKSFGDTDSNWTSSEDKKNKIPLFHVTPRHALMGIFKQKIVGVIDKILKDNPKPREGQRGTISSISSVKPN